MGDHLGIHDVAGKVNVFFLNEGGGECSFTTNPESCLRPYHVESTRSRLITEVKQHWVMLVLGWVTTWEYMMSQAKFNFEWGGCSCTPQKTGIWRVCLLCCPTPPMPIVLNGRRALWGVDISYFEDREFCRNQVILVTSTDIINKGIFFWSWIKLRVFTHWILPLKKWIKQLEAWSLRHLCCAFIENFWDWQN